VPKVDRNRLEIGTFLVLFVFSGYLFWQTLAPVWVPVFLGLIIAVAIYPLQARLLRHPKLAPHPNIVAGLLTSLVMVIIVGLMGFLLTVVGGRVIEFMRHAGERYQERGAPGILGDDLTSLLEKLGFDVSSLQQRLGELARDFGAALGRGATTVITATFALIFIFIFTALTTYYLLIEGREGTRWLIEVVPLPDGEVSELVSDVQDVTRAMLLGTAVVALYQAIVSFIGYWMFGVDSPIVWAALTGIASILPGIGTALIWVPIAIYLIAHHHVLQGVLEIAWGSFVVVFVADYILRPKLVGSRVRMTELLVFIAIFGGIEAFGILGVILGPVAIALFLALVRIYMREYRPGGPPKTPDATRSGESRTPS
jgi:predicted PurR-regulated permease PerM